jgi:hypothetical protein
MYRRNSEKIPKSRLRRFDGGQPLSVYPEQQSVSEQHRTSHEGTNSGSQLGSSQEGPDARLMSALPRKCRDRVGPLRDREYTP